MMEYKNRYGDVFTFEQLENGNIQWRGIIRGFKTKAEAQKFEDHLSKMLGKKDFSLCENVSGITEFRVATNERELILEKIFNK